MHTYFQNEQVLSSNLLRELDSLEASGFEVFAVYPTVHPHFQGRLTVVYRVKGRG